MIIIPFILFVFLRFPRPKLEQGFPIAEGLGLTKDGTLLLLGLILFMQSGMEMTVGGWAATYLNEELFVDAQRAVLFLSLFWFGMVFARLVLGKLLQYISAGLVLRISFSIAFIGSLLMITSTGVGVAVTGLILVGLGFAAVFPVIFAYVGNLFAKLSGTAFSVVLVMALTGGMLYPYITGLIANSYGLRVSLSLIPCSLICGFIVFWIVLKRIRKAEEAEQTVTDYQTVTEKI